MRLLAAKRLGLTLALLMLATAAIARPPCYLDNNKVILLDTVPCPPVSDDPSCAEIGFTGTVRLDCAVRGDGTLHGCLALDERPRGRGLNKRVLALSKRIRLAPLTADGQPVGGRRYRLKYSFLIPHGD